MPKIRVEFDEARVEAVLTSEGPSGPWEILVRTIREFTSEWTEHTPLKIGIPWWIFLHNRKSIGYQIGLHDIDVEFSDRVSKLLQDANEREELLTEAGDRPIISATLLNSRIKENGFKRGLKSFQMSNLQKLCRLPVGASFSVPGSGKTTEAFAFFSYHQHTESRLLVVCPKNAFAAWEEQIRLCLTTADQFVRLRGGHNAIKAIIETAKPRLMLITYEQFPAVANLLAQYLAQFPSFMFLDESHRIKGGDQRIRANAVLRVSPIANYKMVLSGTPLPNGDADLVPQLEFIAPEISVIEESVVEQIQPFFVRTTKADLHLPALHRKLIHIDMPEEQRRLYELLRSEAARQAEAALEKDARRAFRSIGRTAVRLLQYVSNPGLLSGKISSFDPYLANVLEEGDSPKLDWAVRRARQLAKQGKKVIIWSSFVQNVELIAARLADIGATYIHGGVEASSDEEADSREQRILRFHLDKNVMALVANPAACGEGISLHTVCDNAIYVDRNYNAAQYLQSEDRIHRIGSDNEKYVEILSCRDSIDGTVNSRLGEKISRMAEALNDPGLHAIPISLDADSVDLDEDDVLNVLEHLKDAREVFA